MPNKNILDFTKKFNLKVIYKKSGTSKMWKIDVELLNDVARNNFFTCKQFF